MSSIIGKHLNYDAKNLIINGNMDFAQRAPAGTSGMTVTQYTADRFKWATSSGTPQTNFIWDTSVPTLAQSGFLSNNSLKLSAVSTFSPSSSDFVDLLTYIEGYNVAGIMGKPITLSFWVKANFTGTGCVAFINGGSDRSYVLEYTIAAANTWQKVTMQLVMLDGSSGTWNFTNGVGLQVGFALSVGSSSQTTAGAWQSGLFFSTTNQFNFYSSNTNTIQFSQVMLKEGSSVAPFERAAITFDRELEMCQRYYEKSYDLLVAPGTATNSGATWYAFKDSANGINLWLTVDYKVRKRVNPSAPLNFWSIAGTFNNFTEIKQAGTTNDISGASIIQSEQNFNLEVNSSNTTAGFAIHWSTECDF